MTFQAVLPLQFGQVLMEVTGNLGSIPGCDFSSYYFVTGNIYDPKDSNPRPQGSS